ncbi:MAG: asparagine synthase (glutamine-hydrolyzing) [Burkholderiaceae bacterium]|nr:asparagine synthase (glutamine-hydrolyzing) [Burkholderiaceae bacterium]
MCGIAGFVGSGSVADLQRMCAALRHRGPDAADVWMAPAGGLGLAHARLSVLDHAGGAQPMWTPDGRLGIVFNGEIYNFAQLRRDLADRGCAFTSDHSDTEAVLLGYRVWGAQVVERLNGMWAFAIVDLDRGELFASRDRFGKKPFYYQRTRDGLLFASELKALRQHPQCELRIDTLAIKKYFAYGYIPAPLTQYQDILKLPAGHNLLLDIGSGRCTVERHWRLRLAPRPVPDEGRAADHLLEVLDAAVARRLVADVPVGMFLSGGIDSSLVSALAMRHLERGRLKTFNIGFDEASFDESSHARRVAAHIGSEHIEKRLRVQDVLGLIDTVAMRMDEPLADASLLPTYLVSQLAREHVTVALGGDGADELFAGYGPFQALRWARWLHALCPDSGLRAMQWLAGHMPVSHGYMSLDFKIKRALGGLRHPPPMWVPAWMAPMELSRINMLVDDGKTHTAAEIYSEAIESWESCAQPDLTSRASQQFSELYLQDDILAKVDRASMMNALEVRAPFLDREVADFARQLPSALKLHGGTTKYLLKQAALQVLPVDVVHRPKQGFAVPVGRWFARGELALDIGRLPGFIDGAEVRSRWDQHRQGRADERLFLWAVLMLEKTMGTG